MKDYTEFNRRITWGFFAYLAVLVTFFVGFLFRDYVHRMDSYVCNTRQHTVSYGETLWEIAQSNCSGSIQSAVDDLVKTYGSTIQNGQVIDLPTK
jgi:hypothetical protein